MIMIMIILITINLLESIWTTNRRTGDKTQCKNRQKAYCIKPYRELQIGLVVRQNDVAVLGPVEEVALLLVVEAVAVRGPLEVQLNAGVRITEVLRVAVVLVALCIKGVRGGCAGLDGVHKHEPGAIHNQANEGYDDGDNRHHAACDSYPPEYNSIIVCFR